MSACYYLLALKTGALIRQLRSPYSKSALDLIRLPAAGDRKHLLCGVETEAYLLVDFSEGGGTRLLERAAVGN